MKIKRKIKLGLKIALAVGAALALLTLLAAGPILKLGLGWLKNHLAGQGYELSLGEISGHPLDKLRLENINLSRNGIQILRLEALTLKPRLAGFLQGQIEFSLIELQKPEVDYSSLLLPEPEPGGEESELRLPAIAVSEFKLGRGSFNWAEQNLQLRDMNISASLLFKSGSLALGLKEAQFICPAVGPEALRIQGGINISSHAAILEQVILRQGVNQALAQGLIDRDEPAASDLTLEISYARHYLDQLGEPNHALTHPLELKLGLKGQENDWLLAFSADQGASRLRLEGKVDPLLMAYEFKGQAGDFTPSGMEIKPLAGLPPVRLNGDIHLRGNRRELTFYLQSLFFQAREAREIEGQIAWPGEAWRIARLELREGSGSLKAEGTIYYPLEKGESLIRIEAREFSLGPEIKDIWPQMPAQAKLGGQLEARGSPAAGRFALEVNAEAGPAFPPTSISALLQWGGGGLDIQKGVLLTPWGKASLAGQLAPQRFALDFSFEFNEINPLLRLLPGAEPAYFPNSGLLKGNGRLQGSLERPELSLKAQGANLSGPDMDLRALEADLALLWPGRLTGSLQARGLRLGGLSVRQAELSSNIQLRQGSANLRLSGMEGWRIETALAPLNDDWSRWQIRDTRLIDPQRLIWDQPAPAELGWSGDSFSLSELGLRENAQRINLSFTHNPGVQEGKLTLENFALAQLLSQGSLPARPLLNLHLSWENGPQELRFACRGRAKAAWEGALTTIDFSGAAEPPLWRLQARASTPQAMLADISLSLDPAAPASSLRATIKSQQAPLGPLQPFIPHVSELQGVMDIDLQAQADRQGQLQASGQLQLTGVEFMVERLGQHISDLNARLFCRDNGLWIDSFHLNSGSGHIELGGKVGWPGREEEIGLNLAAENINIDLSPLGELLVDGKLFLSGTYARPRLKGEITGKSARVKIFRAAAEGLDDIVMLHSAQLIPEMRFAGEPEPSFSLPPILDSWEISLEAGLAKNFQVAIAEGWCILGGSARLDKAAYAPPRVSGGYQIERGILVVLGARIEQIKGGIEFNDPSGISPELNIRASVRYDLTDIRLSLSGPAIEPRVNINSDPPMSQTDILSLLAFGRPLHELNQQEGSSLSNQALALAMIGEQGRKEMRHILGPALTPDVITSHNDIQQGSALEAGKYLRDDLYLRYRQGTDEKSDFQNLGLEWRLTPNITLQGQVGTRQDSGMDIFFHFAFGGQPRARENSALQTQSLP